MGAKSRIAPHQNYLPRTVPCWIPTGLGTTKFKSGISLSDPHQPKPMLQILPPMLRMNPVGPIRSCSKAPGVFSSNYRYPASSPEVHFHRASPRDSFPVITPFVHVGTYPTRNCALRFLLAREGPYLVPLARNMTYGLSFESNWTKYELLHTQVTWCVSIYPTIVLVLRVTTEVVTRTLGRL